jgi:hypothetical protein
MTNFHYYDNLTRSIRQTGRIILDLIPKIYDRERILRIIGDDGKPEILTINQFGQDEDGVTKILNDVTVGEYDVVMDTGPGYNSKRQEAVDSMMALFAADPTLIQQAGDLLVRNMDFPGAETIADRLAVNNPLAKIDDKSKIPPRVQMQLAQSQDAIQQLQQQVQSLQAFIQQRSDIEGVRQDAETQRKLMDVTAKAHDTEMREETSRRNTDANNETKVEIEQLKAQIALILANMSGSNADLVNAETIERAV